MIKRIIAFAVAVSMAVTALAIPAIPGFRTYTQPDGKTLTLQLKGDEWGSWFESKSGVRYQRDAQGYFHQISEADARTMARTFAAKRRLANQLRDVPFTDMTHGTRRIPVFLVEFSDVKFTIDNPADNFYKLLNQEGYNGYQGKGATGSVRDFYLDNSHGAFEPVFDIYGPVTLNQTLAYYGAQVTDGSGKVTAHDKQAEVALWDAVIKLDSQVDFSNYDYNNDGLVDMILFYYAGGSQAEGWSTDAIWPHQWDIRYSSHINARSRTFDGKYLGRYFCTAELKGSNPSSSTMCSIGPTCHEFAHSLGLPDFYDTDYEENGYSGGLYYASTMCSGPYLDDSRTPPYFNAEERIMLGWMEESDVRDLTSGEHTLQNIDNNVAMKSYATESGEYFLYENRGGGKWDKALPQGLAVYHVDKSPEHNVNGMSAERIWSTNSINAYGDHPCFYLVIPSSQESLNYPLARLSEMFFPGYDRISSYVPVDWQGENGIYQINDITVSGDLVRFKVKNISGNFTVDGSVYDTAGNPVPGALVSLRSIVDEDTSSNIRIRLASTLIAQTATDANGRFSFEVEPDGPKDLEVSVKKDGYVARSKNFSLSGKITHVSMNLRKVDEFAFSSDIDFYDKEAQLYYAGSTGLTSLMMAAACPEKVWGAYEGLQIESVDIYAYQDASAYYLILDTEDGMQSIKLDSFFPQSHTKVDLRNKDLRVPSGDFKIGYAVKDAVFRDENHKYPMVCAQGGGYYYAEFNLDSPSWQERSGYDIVMTVTLFDDAYVRNLRDLGYTMIDLPDNVKSGDTLDLKLKVGRGLTVKQTLWFMDGEECDRTVTLNAGWHNILAEIVYEDGTTETVEKDVEVK